MVGAAIGHGTSPPPETKEKGEKAKRANMSDNMTRDEYWAHPSTQCEVELLQETLRSIAHQLGTKHAAYLLPSLNLILENVRSRLVRLERETIPLKVRSVFPWRARSARR